MVGSGPGWVVALVGGGVVSLRNGRALPGRELPVALVGGCRGWAWSCGGVAARMLRTSQWTRASLFSVAQVFKGARWMPWHQEPKKDVGICDKPRGVDNQTVIRGFPNGETRLEASPVTRS